MEDIKNKKVKVKLKKNKDIIKNEKILEEDKTDIISKESKESKNSNDNKKKTFILEPVKFPDFINLEILKEYVKKDINSNTEYFDDLKITYKISDPKKAEWVLNKSLKKGKLVGNGSTNVDIISEKNAIDVSVLTLNGNYTNEKSIMQNFSECNDLDSLFVNKDGNKAVDIFKNKFTNKCKFEDENTKMYYMIFICKDKNIYMSSLLLNSKNISEMKCSSFTKSCKNILIDNFIESKYGNVRLYKSKKRLELRLHKNILDLDCTVKLF
jgi:hypothetical protein